MHLLQGGWVPAGRPAAVDQRCGNTAVEVAALAHHTLMYLQRPGGAHLGARSS